MRSLPYLDSRKPELVAVVLMGCKTRTSVLKSPSIRRIGFDGGEKVSLACLAILIASGAGV